MSQSLERTDEELVEDYLVGDAAAFRVLIERYHDPLLRFLFRLTGSRQTAEDVFQETFLQVHQSLDSFDPARTFKPWLFTIAANKGRDALRKIQRRSAVSLSSRFGEDQGDALVDLLEIPAAGPGAALEAQELSAMVQRAIDTIPPRLREILLLAYFQKMTYAQLAETLSIPIGTVKSRLHAAVASFAKAWQDQAASAESQRSRASGSTREHSG